MFNLFSCTKNESPIKFTEVAKKVGIRFRHNFGAKNPRNILMTTGNGCAFFDYDNDGFLDVFLVNSTTLDSKGKIIPERATYHALYHNRGDGTFENVTKAANITKVSYGQGCAIADYDGDGYEDLYITNYGPNILYHNRGDGTFEDVTEHSGTGDPRYSTGAVFFDYDGDGDLDLFVANYIKFPVEHHSWKKPHLRGPRYYDAEDDGLYRNNGDGTFTDVSKEVGLVSGGKALMVMTSDFDGDGDQDIFIANDRTPNFLYENLGGHFKEIGLQAGIALDQNGNQTAGMGLDIVDVNGDTRPDVYVTNFHWEYNNLYVNQGGLFFLDMLSSLGLDKNIWNHTGWATRLMDFNNDGYLDCFVAQGGLWAYRKTLPYGVTYPQKNFLFLGTPDGLFKQATNICGKAFQRKHVSRGAAFGDYDNDGDIDILVSNSGDWASLYRNDTPVNDRWLKIKVKGQPPNTDGIGAKVYVHIGNRTIFSEVRCSVAYLSSSDPTIHIGLRPGEFEGEAEVLWPSGKKSVAKVHAAKITIIEEPK